jgi:glutamate synthase (NADPH/NADH) large chain
MTGGRAFVWDPKGALAPRVNMALVETAHPDPELLEELRWTVERHHELTGSPRALALLDQWEAAAADFWLVAPADEIRRIQDQQAAREAVA